MAEERSIGKYLSREDILGAGDAVTEGVPCPEWGGTVLVKGLTGAERDAWEASLLTGRGANRDVNMANVRAKLVAAAVVDGSGNRLFLPTDVEALGQKSAAALSRVYDTAARLAGVTKADEEELAGN